MVHACLFEQSADQVAGSSEGRFGGPHTLTHTHTHILIQFHPSSHKSPGTDGSNRRRLSHPHSPFTFYSVAAWLFVFIDVSLHRKVGGMEPGGWWGGWEDGCQADCVMLMLVAPSTPPGPAGSGCLQAEPEQRSPRPSSPRVIILWAVH